MKKCYVVVEKKGKGKIYCIEGKDDFILERNERAFKDSFESDLEVSIESFNTKEEAKVALHNYVVSFVDDYYWEFYKEVFHMENSYKDDFCEDDIYYD